MHACFQIVNQLFINNNNNILRKDHKHHNVLTNIIAEQNAHQQSQNEKVKEEEI